MLKYEEDKNGFVTFFDVLITKTGVFPYKGASIDPTGKLGLDREKVYMVYRPESELNNEETIKSFSLQPWIPHHEMLGDEYTPAETVGVQGTTGERVYWKGNGLYTNLRLFGKGLKSAIKAGLKELSCGFGCSWQVASGTTPDGIKYDVIQRDIFGNHLASVPQGRMGSDVGIAMDRAVFALDELDIDLTSKGESMTIEELMKQVKEAKPAMEELKKLHAEIGSMIGGGEESPEVMDEEVPAEDMEDEPAEDGDKSYDEEDKDKGVAMDAAVIAEAVKSAIAPLNDRLAKLEGAAMDSAEQELKADVVKLAKPFIGGVDVSTMKAIDVAKKALEAKGIACDSGEEIATLKVMAAMYRQPQTTIDHGTALDSSEDMPESLKGVLR